MDAFFNLGIFLVAFYLILLYAGWPDRRKDRAAGGVRPRTEDKRVA